MKIKARTIHSSMPYLTLLCYLVLASSNPPNKSPFFNLTSRWSNHGIRTSTSLTSWSNERSKLRTIILALKFSRFVSLGDLQEEPSWLNLERKQLPLRISMALNLPSQTARCTQIIQMFVVLQIWRCTSYKYLHGELPQTHHPTKKNASIAALNQGE